MQINKDAYPCPQRASFAKTHTQSPVGEEPWVPPVPYLQSWQRLQPSSRGEGEVQLSPRESPSCWALTTAAWQTCPLPLCTTLSCFLNPGRRGSRLPRCNWAGSRMQPGEHRPAARADPGLPSYPHPRPLAWQPCLSDLKIQHHFHSVSLPCNWEGRGRGGVYSTYPYLGSGLHEQDPSFSAEPRFY